MIILILDSIEVFKIKLEQIERLRSEDTSTTSWLPILLSHIRSQVKRRQSQIHKFNEFARQTSWNQYTPFFNFVEAGV